MALEDIIKKIEQDGRSEIETIIKEGEVEANKIREEMRLKVEKLRAATNKAIEEEIALKKSTKILSYKNEIKKEILSKKQEYLDIFFKDYKDYLLNLPMKEYQDLIIRLIVPDLKTGNEEIIISDSEKKINKEFLVKLKKVSGIRNFNIKISQERRKFSAGVIIKTENYEVNHTFDFLLKNLRENFEIEIMNILFK